MVMAGWVVLWSFVSLGAEGVRERQLVSDADFQQGLILWKPRPGAHDPYGEVVGFSTNAPRWGLSQWNSRWPVDATTNAINSSPSRTVRNAAKSIQFGAAGAQLSLAANTAVEYGSRARQRLDPWVHLLVEQEFLTPVFLQSLVWARFHLETKLVRARNLHQGDYDPGIHAAQFQLFFTIQNRNRQSSGWGDFLWFGIPIFDNRHRHPPEFKSQDFGGTGKYIFTPAATLFTSRSTHDEAWVVIDQDLRPLLLESLETAWAKGFLQDSKSLADYAISGMNMGWELPGTFDVAMETRGLSVTVAERVDREVTVSSDDTRLLPKKELPLPGRVLTVAGQTAFVIPAGESAAAHAKPWVWYAPTLPGLPGPEEQWMFRRFLQAGIAVAGIDVGESYGSPAGQQLFTEFYRAMTERGYSPRPVLLGRSRGGLMTLSWATTHPSQVGGFAGIYPVCDLASYPGVDKAALAYRMSAQELAMHLQEYNPIDQLASLAKANVPLFAIHGDVDTVVPLSDNSGKMRDRYKELGGSMELIVASGQGHNMWPGFFQNEELVKFVKAHAGPTITVNSPVDFAVIQRKDRTTGILNLRGEISGIDDGDLMLEARLIVGGKPTPWRQISMNFEKKAFAMLWEAPAGGWHRLEIRAVSGRGVITETVVEHVGVGEVFVVAGQSNSANHGSEKQTSATGLVAAFDGQGWQLANDPQPGASGGGGSFLPPFGDLLVQDFKVPVGFVACGVGATSVREWLPKGSTFPHPPTLTNHVIARADGTWESNGEIYDRFIERMRQLDTSGFRAVLWHQGESDAHQDDVERTLPGELYRQYLTQLIRDFQRAMGWPSPWFVAQASYHHPGDEGSPDIRAAQAALWESGIAMEGPDTDAIKGDFRDDAGRGVHFSGPGLREHAARWFSKVAPWVESRLQ